MKIAVVWYFDKAKWVWPRYRDGVKAAMEIIGKEHEVQWFLGTEDLPAFDSFDFILNWDNSTSEFIPLMSKYSCRKGLILTTDLGLDINALRAYDVIFAEAQPVVDKIRPHGIRVVKAFGTDDEFFSPEFAVTCNHDIYFEAFYPATFSPWKRNDEFAAKYKDKGLMVGTVQPDGWEIYKKSIDCGCSVMTGYFPVEMIRDFYLMSETVDITAWEGSGRTVLEGLSMGLPVTVSKDNHKAYSYIQEWEESKMEPRDFIKASYSAKIYAQLLLKGMHD